MTHEPRDFPVVLHQGQDGYLIAECPAFEGCFTQGKTRDEALANIQEAIAACLLAGDVPAEIAHVTVAA
jgi:predicted RNase H-like HicB family nuclease